MTTTATRRTTISQRKHATIGPDYDSAWIGQRVRWVSHDGTSHEGIIESIDHISGAKARFTDGRWATIGWSVTLMASN